MRNIFLIFLFLLNYIALSSQEVIDSTRLKEADSLFEQAVNIYNTDQDSAIVLIRRTADLYKEAKSWGQYIMCLNALATVNYNKNNFILFNTYANLAVVESERLLPSNHMEYASALNNLNAGYYELGNYSKSIECLQKSLKIKRENKANGLDLAYTFNNIGISMDANGEYINGLEYLNKALELRQDTFKKNPLAQVHQEVIASKLNIGWSYLQNNQYDQAFRFYNESLNDLQKVEDQKNNLTIRKLINAFQNTAKIHFLKGEYQQSENRIKKALELQKENNAFRKSFSYEMLGKIFLAQNQFDLAVDYFQKALVLAEEFYAKTNPPDYARKYSLLGKANEQLKRFDESLLHYQKALHILAPGFNASDFGINPLPSALYSKPDALEVLEEKANALWNKYLNENIELDLQATLKTYKVGIEVIKAIRQNILTREAKNILSEKTIPVYEGAIRTILEQYKLNKENTLLQEAFVFAESNKGLLLLESVNEQAALGLKGLPDSLIQLERSLRLNMTYYQRKILESIDKDNSQQEIKQWKDELFDSRENLQQLTGHFEKQYPRFYNLKYQHETPNLTLLQNHLKKNNQALIEYFVGDKNLYAFVLWSDGINVFTVEDPNALFSQVGMLKNAITQLPADAEVLQNYQDYAAAAYFLYQQLLEPAIKFLPKDIHALKIIPDYHLNYIPFDLLLTKPANPNIAHFSPDYLAYVLNNYQISYDYSATLMLKSKNNKQNNYKNNFIAYAPSFQQATAIKTSRSCQEGELYQLACSQEEVERINELLGGDIRINDAASTSAFEQEAADYKIIHMATHACADEANPLFNKIFLTNDYLSNADLYNTQLQADLVVLSACNTGSGKLVKGEGVMSLARGFVQAGCASSVVSRWSVDDCATSNIMQHFYKQLKEGKAKDEALRLAKLDYLDNADQLHAHPYFWSAFVAYGDMGTMELGSGHWWFYILGGVLLIALIFLTRRMVT